MVLHRWIGSAEMRSLRRLLCLLRPWMLAALSFVLIAVAGGCAYSPAGLPLIDASGYDGAVHQVLVATSRAETDNPVLRFGDERADQISYEEVMVWTPADREPGAVVYPSKDPKPAKEFAVTGVERISKGQFEARLRQQLDLLSGAKTAFLFVHGYNVPYANGIYRHAQVIEDFDATGVAIHYSWPSSGRSLGYLYDRDSVQFARDGLVEVLEACEAAEVDNIFLMGHSMGTLLVMEALRQLSLTKREAVLRRVSPLVLASPDIDADVFRSQFRAVDPKPEPVVVFVSRKDGALKLSERLRGGQARIGDGKNIQSLQDLGIVVIDLSKLKKGEGTNHSAFASSPTLIRALRQVNVAEQTQGDADRQGNRLNPLRALRDLTDGIVYIPE
ncbi:MAG: alpha/beta fold hydrolase [Pseudomonadota bacterium]